MLCWGFGSSESVDKAHFLGFGRLCVMSPIDGNDMASLVVLMWSRKEDLGILVAQDHTIGEEVDTPFSVGDFFDSKEWLSHG